MTDQTETTAPERRISWMTKEERQLLNEAAFLLRAPGLGESITSTTSLELGRKIAAHLRATRGGDIIDGPDEHGLVAREGERGRSRPELTYAYRNHAREQIDAIIAGRDHARSGMHYRPVVISCSPEVSEVDSYRAGYINEMTKTPWRRWLFRLSTRLEGTAIGAPYGLGAIVRRDR